MNRKEFINLYPTVKTLGFELKPQGKTHDTIVANKYFEYDEELQQEYQKMKKTLDLYHRSLIQEVLKNASAAIRLDTEILYYGFYMASDEAKQDGNFSKAYDKALENARKNFVVTTDNKELRNRLNHLNDKELITKMVPDWLKTQSESLYWSNVFDKRTTYFNHYNKSRTHLYDPQGGHGSVAYRAIDDNLFIFMENMKRYTQNLEDIHDRLEVIYTDVEPYLNVSTIADVFTTDNYENCLTQNGITAYNLVIGGYTTEDGKKVQGVNEIINEINQKEGRRFPKLKKLRNQILYNDDTVSFVPPKFNTLNEVFEAISNYVKTSAQSYADLNNLLRQINTECDKSKIFLRTGKTLNHLSNQYFGNFNVIRNLTNGEKAISLQALEDGLQKYEDNAVNYDGKYLPSSFWNILLSDITSFSIKERVRPIQKLLSENADGKVLKQHEKVAIKQFLDDVLQVERLLALFNVHDDEVAERDVAFYSDFEIAFEVVSTIVPLYNKTRNYLTQKPYETKKLPLSFGVTNWMNGWKTDFQKSSAYLLKKDGYYYLFALLDTVSKTEKEELNNGNDIRYVYYKQKADNRNLPRKFFYSSRKNNKIAPAVQQYNLPFDEVLPVYEEKHWAVSYAEVDPAEQKKALATLIDYFKLGLSRDKDFAHFDFKWKETSEYRDISEFYNDVSKCCFKMEETGIDFDKVESLVDNGRAVLFQIYSKDFSKAKHGKKSLYGMYWEALFDKEGQSVYTLNSDATIYYRKASIDKQKAIRHPANQPIDLKNPYQKGKTRILPYDVVKDKRYTEDKYLLSVSLTANFTATERINQSKLNEKVCEWIRKTPDVNIIGVHRGERNLLHITITDKTGSILYDSNNKPLSFDMNVVDSSYRDSDGNTIVVKTPYQEMLKNKAVERQEQRYNWDSINNIKNIKSGYCSRAVGFIANLAIQYNAVIVLEDLDSIFKQKRSALEQEVYRAFERDLVKKLSFMVSKNVDVNTPGGLYRPLQLTMVETGQGDIHWRQNGIIFYVEPYKISAVDPVTGFVDLFDKCYKASEKKAFFTKFEKIWYEDNQFFFRFDYSDFNVKYTGKIHQWTLTSKGNIRHVWDSHKNHNKGGYRELHVTEEMENILQKCKIEYAEGNNLVDFISTLTGQDLHDFYYYFRVLMIITYYGPQEQYIVSPAIDEDGISFDSRHSTFTIVNSADSNASYNIARKGTLLMQRILQANSEEKARLFISNEDWLSFIQ